MKRFIFPAFVAACLIGCATTAKKERDVALIIVDGGGPVRMVGLHRGEKGPQLLVVRTVLDRKGAERTHGEYLDINGGIESKILKQIESIEKVARTTGIQRGNTNDARFALQFQLLDKKPPRQFVVETTIGADTNIMTLVQMINEETAKKFTPGGK